MKVDQLERIDFGRLRGTDDEYVWFDPAPMPTRLRLDAQTQLALSDADAALGRLSGVGGMLKEPSVLIRPYLIREALASARIEGTQAKLDEIFEAETRRHHIRVPDIYDVVRNARSLEKGLQRSAEPLSVSTICELHRTLMSTGSPEGDNAGKLRTQVVWIDSPTNRPETARFVPPIGEAMERSLDDFERFLTKSPTIPVLVRAALLHYQFLTIHPFTDGNGRVGRTLVMLYLLQQGRLSVPLLYLSSYLDERRQEYFDRLQAVRERGEIQQWIQFFLTAVATQADDGVARARRLLDLRERYREELAGSRSRAIEVVEILFENPVVDTSVVRRRLGVTNQGALNLIRSLQSRQWLERLGSIGKGGSSAWIALEIYNAIEGDVRGD